MAKKAQASRLMGWRKGWEDGERVMRWLRSHTRLGSWAALFALAIQLALSFGHVHVGGGDPRSWGPLVLRLAAEPPPGLPDAPAVPANHKPAGLAHDLCVICSAMQLAYTAAPSPSVPLPAAVSKILLDPSGDFAIAASPHRPFRARAPPYA